MTKPKYQIGDRFQVSNSVEIKIVRILDSIDTVRYVFALVDFPVFQAAVGEDALDPIATTIKPRV